MRALVSILAVLAVLVTACGTQGSTNGVGSTGAQASFTSIDVTRAAVPSQDNQMLVILWMTLKNTGNAPLKFSVFDVHVSVGGHAYATALTAPNSGKRRPGSCGANCYVGVARFITPTATVLIATIQPGHVFTWRDNGYWVPRTACGEKVSIEVGLISVRPTATIACPSS